MDAKNLLTDLESVIIVRTKTAINRISLYSGTRNTSGSTDIIKAPIIAPGILPLPPRITAA